MREAEILAELRRRLPEILPEGRVRWLPSPARPGKPQVDALAEFEIAGRRLRLAVELLDQPNPARIRDHGENIKRLAAGLGPAVPVLVAPHLNEDLRRRCREAGVRFIDLSGNVWLQDGPVLIQKEVARNLYPHESKERSPFADKASLVLRHLIGVDRPAGIREIAAAVGLDPGYVSRVVHSAVERGYASSDRGRARLRNIEEMLEDWSAAYSWRRNKARGFLWLAKNDRAPLRERLLGYVRRWPHKSYALSLHAGNNLVRPFADYDVWHVYARGEDIAKRLSAIPGVQPAPADAANVVLMEPYYAESAFFGARVVQGVRVVSDLQLHLDLRRFPVRGREAADEILHRRLRKLWKATS